MSMGKNWVNCGSAWQQTVPCANWQEQPDNHTQPPLPRIADSTYCTTPEVVSPMPDILYTPTSSEPLQQQPEDCTYPSTLVQMPNCYSCNTSPNTYTQHQGPCLHRCEVCHMITQRHPCNWPQPRCLEVSGKWACGVGQEVLSCMRNCHSEYTVNGARRVFCPYHMDR